MHARSTQLQHNHFTSKSFEHQRSRRRRRPLITWRVESSVAAALASPLHDSRMGVAQLLVELQQRSVLLQQLEHLGRLLLRNA